MNEIAILNSSAIADAMLKRVGELLREHDAAKAGEPGGNSPFRLASYFANEAPEGAKPQYAQVAEEFSHFPDVFPLYFGPSDSIHAELPARLIPDRVTELWNGMGGYDAFCKAWGYIQFAQVVEDEVRAALFAALGLNENDDPQIPRPNMARLVERIDAAIERITSGNAVMRVPADETDPDLVLAECRRVLHTGTARANYVPDIAAELGLNEHSTAPSQGTDAVSEAQGAA
ncbi:hypothetical protein PQR39_26345 [Paraburkholderia sediminicola]|uniref:hypothetical protein n=1 Tax=Paraburkholderia sediminicola TaxID=458836 RepID=UPI0038BA2157